jgi:hypothetical protein
MHPDERRDQERDLRIAGAYWASIGPDNRRKPDEWSWTILESDGNGDSTEIEAGFADNEDAAKQAVADWGMAHQRPQCPLPRRGQATVAAMRQVASMAGESIHCGPCGAEVEEHDTGLWETGGDSAGQRRYCAESRDHLHHPARANLAEGDRSVNDVGADYGDECVIALASGRTIRTDSYADSPEGSTYVRVCDLDGAEVGYWTSDEWREAPEEVMGAILGAAKGGRRASSAPELRPEWPGGEEKSVNMIDPHNDKCWACDPSIPVRFPGEPHCTCAVKCGSPFCQPPTAPASARTGRAAIGQARIEVALTDGQLAAIRAALAAFGPSDPQLAGDRDSAAELLERHA